MRNLTLRVIFVGLLLSLAGYFFLLKGGDKPAHTPLSDTGTTRKSADLVKKQPLVQQGGDKPARTPLPDTGTTPKSVPIFKIPSVFSRGQFPRDPDESQKTRLNTQFTMKCNTTEDCCAAKACIKGICTGCSTSNDCMADETCAIDHCIPRQQATCETRHDCESGDHCVLSRQKNNAKRGVFFSGKNCRNNKKFSSRCEKKLWSDPKPDRKFKLRGFSEWGPPELLLEWKVLELSEGRLTVNLVVTPLKQHAELFFRYATQKRRGERYNLPRNKGYQFIELFDVKAEPTVIVENLVVPSSDNGFYYLDAEIYYRNADVGRVGGDARDFYYYVVNGKIELISSERWGKGYDYGACGWSNYYTIARDDNNYACGGMGEDPDGEFSRACPVDIEEGSSCLEASQQRGCCAYGGGSWACEDGLYTQTFGCGGVARCGDGIVEFEEPCDDGNLVDDDDCTNFCRLPE